MFSEVALGEPEGKFNTIWVSICLWWFHPLFHKHSNSAPNCIIYNRILSQNIQLSAVRHHFHIHMQWVRTRNSHAQDLHLLQNHSDRVKAWIGKWHQKSRTTYKTQEQYGGILSIKTWIWSRTTSGTPSILLPQKCHPPPPLTVMLIGVFIIIIVVI